MSTVLDDILGRLTALPEDDRQQIIEEASRIDRLWVPNPGSQTEAYFSEADEIGYGGEAGPGKTDLLIGLSLEEHQRSLVLRRTNKEARKLVDRYLEIIGHRIGLNTAENVWRLGKKVIDYGGVEHEDDKQKYKGTPHDLIGFDEVVDFTRSQYEFIIQWNRSTTPGQNCRVVATFNPPTRPVGLWVIERWAPWLDPKHPNPAKSGEIRWFTTIDGKDTEVDGPGPHLIDGKPTMAKSRTFIRGYLHENPDLAATGYDATRAAAPRELRDAYRSGNFEASLADVPGQLIPTQWVRAAQQRRTEKPPEQVPMCAIGVDASGGGHDPMVLAIRYDGWFDDLVEVAGKDLPLERLGAMSAGVIVSYRKDDATVIVDMGGGYGGPIYEKLYENKVEAVAYKGAEATSLRTHDRKLGFANVRSAAMWKFREALDPGQDGGSPIMLPEDSKLVADLTAPTFEVTPRGIKVEDKKDVVARLGRSPDHGDAVVMSWWAGATAVTDRRQWEQMGLAPGSVPKVVLGHQSARRKRR